MSGDNMDTNNPHFNISMIEHQSSSNSDLHVIIIVVLLVIILLVLAAIVMFKFGTRLVYKYREQQAEKALARAINIYNSQEPLEEPDCVHIRPGDHNCHRSTRGGRNQSEIAFVHSDGRIERFRLLINSNTIREESVSAMEQGCNTWRSQPHINGPHNRHVAGDEEAYINFQPGCAKLESIPARCLITDNRDYVSLRGCDIPPSYDEALEMPGVDSVLENNGKNLDVRGKSELGYCNVEIGKQNMQTASKGFVAFDG